MKYKHVLFNSRERKKWHKREGRKHNNENVNTGHDVRVGFLLLW